MTDDQLSFLRAVVACWLADKVTTRAVVGQHLGVELPEALWRARGYTLVDAGLVSWCTVELARLQPTPRGVSLAMMRDDTVAVLGSRSISYDDYAPITGEVGSLRPPSLESVERLLQNASWRGGGVGARNVVTALVEVRALIRGGW